MSTARLVASLSRISRAISRRFQPAPFPGCAANREAKQNKKQQSGDRQYDRKNRGN